MSGPAAGRPRMLVLAGSSAAAQERDAHLRAIAADEIPDVIYAEETFGAVSFGDRELAELPGRRWRLVRRLPAPVALAIAVWARRGDFDVVLSWGERLAFPLAALLAITPRRRPGHIAMLLRPFHEGRATGPKRLVKRHVFSLLARHGIDRFWVPAPLQRRFAIERWRIPAERFLGVGWMVDTHFWRPIDRPQETLSSAGRELRDYATLIQALRGLDIPCHIAAGTGELSEAYGTLDPEASDLAAAELPPGVTVGAMPPADLRDLYARSRIVVVPILPSESDNGITTITEAMAMGHAVITTDTEGKSELLQDGVTCLLVPPQDPDALRAAIRALWDDPEQRARLAAHGRERIRSAYQLHHWTDAVRAAAAELTGAR